MTRSIGSWISFPHCSLDFSSFWFCVWRGDPVEWASHAHTFVFIKIWLSFPLLGCFLPAWKFCGCFLPSFLSFRTLWWSLLRSVTPSYRYPRNGCFLSLPERMPYRRTYSGGDSFWEWISFIFLWGYLWWKSICPEENLWRGKLYLTCRVSWRFPRLPG